MPDKRRTALDEAEFPIGLLTSAVVLTMVAFAWCGWLLFDAMHHAQLARECATRIEHLGGIVVHSGEVLSGSVRLPAITRNAKWEVAVYRPRSGVTPEAIANASASGRATMPTTTPAARSRPIFSRV